MPLYIATLVLFVLALIALYALWLANRLPRVRLLLFLLAVTGLVATVILRKLEP